MALVRSISGLRATLGEELTPELIMQYVAGFAAIMPEGIIAIGRDGRESGKWIESVCVGTLEACGRDVLNLGVVPTPTVQLYAEKNINAAGGIAITASHNPSQWNGLKFINSEGTFLDAEFNAKLWEKVDNKQLGFKQGAFGKSNDEPNAIETHIQMILDIPLFNSEVIESIKSKKYKIVVDAVNASGSVAVPALLKKLGCEVVELYCTGSGKFPHTPEPLPENLTELAKAVAIHKSDLGIAVDPDADRLVLIDETGTAIGEEKTICLSIDAVLSNLEKIDNASAVCTVNHSTTMLADYIAKKYNGVCTRAAVGEINVVNEMKKSGAAIGGEGSGGVILPACHYGRDSLVGIALLLILLAQKNQKLSEIVLEYPNYQMLKTKLPFTGDLDNFISEIKVKFADSKIIAEDGIKIITDSSWVQLRKSNTEPIIRIIAEAESIEEVNHLIKTITDIVNV